MADKRPTFEFLRLLFAPCDEIAHLTSQSLDRSLPWHERIAMKVHLAYCKACRRYRRHALVLREILTRYAARLEGREPAAGPALSPAARERIRRALINP